MIMSESNKPHFLLSLHLNVYVKLSFIYPRLCTFVESAVNIGYFTITPSMFVYLVSTLSPVSC